MSLTVIALKSIPDLGDIAQVKSSAIGICTENHILKSTLVNFPLRTESGCRPARSEEPPGISTEELRIAETTSSKLRP